MVQIMGPYPIESWTGLAILQEAQIGFGISSIARSHNYHEMVLSMKSSNPKVMIEAYRLVVSLMNEEGMDYPLHLGVTEAGDGDARIKVPSE